MTSKATPAAWQLFYFKLFKEALDELEQTVTQLAQQQPAAYKSHPKTRLLASVYKCITQLVPANPNGHGKDAAREDEFCHARFPHPNPPPEGEGANESLREFHVNHSDFRLGKTLGSEYANWRRVKKGMPDRYRLFFRFVSSPVQLIVYVWFNDEDTLRKAGSKTDVYEGFKRMLMRGEVPASINALLAESRKP